MSLLDEILAHKRKVVAARKAECPVHYLQSLACARPAETPLSTSLRAAPMGLIAEVKRCSPSAGVIREPFEPGRLAADYARAGAQGISVLIDRKYFGGGIRDLSEVRGACLVPLLYKEFVVDPWQVWEAAAFGASAVLLIAAALEQDVLVHLREVCACAGVEALVEVHDAEEMRRAVDAGPDLVGVNNRDLRTFSVSLDTSLALAELAPEGCTLVSESGIGSTADVTRLQDAGFHAVLVGEHLLRQPDVSRAVRELMGEVWPSS